MERRRGWEFSDRIDFNVIIIHTWGGGLSSNLKERNCEIVLQVSTMVLQQNWFYTPATATKTYGPTLKVHFSLFHFECLKNVPFQRSGQCSISIPAENLKIPQVFWRSEEVWKTNIVLQWDIMASKSCAKIFGPRCCSSISTLSVSWKILGNI